MVVIGVGVGSAHSVRKFVVVVVDVHPYNVVFWSPVTGPLVLVKIHEPVGAGVGEGVMHAELIHVCVGMVLHPQMSAPVVSIVAYCPVMVPVEQPQYVSAGHTTSAPSPH